MDRKVKLFYVNVVLRFVCKCNQGDYLILKGPHSKPDSVFWLPNHND